MQRQVTPAIKSVRGTLYAQAPGELISVSDVLRNAFSGYVSLSDVRENREGDGYHLLVHIYLKEDRSLGK
jgi:hypothetical protein